jgi:nucleotide-binding universal stress UspA family protein
VSPEAAPEFAADLAMHFDADLHLLAVARPPEFGDDVETEAVIEQAQERLGALLAPLPRRLRTLRVHTSSQIGHPAEKIVSYAEQHRVEHIVVGHRGHSMLDRWLLGSDARRVVAHAPRAVTVVRPQAVTRDPLTTRPTALP